MYSIFELDNGKMVLQGPFISEHQVNEDPLALVVLNRKILKIFSEERSVVEQRGRGKTSVSVLEALANGRLDPHNIAFHLFT